MSRLLRPAPPPADPARIAAAGGWPVGGFFAAVLALLLLLYGPSLGGDLLWDDVGHITAPELRSWPGLLRIWFEPGTTQQYYPLLHSAFWLEFRLWGDATFGYHLVNVLWHAVSASLFLAILRRLAVPGALLAAAVFALHPVNVESVAWIAEQKNTLSTLFYLAAALAWLRYEEERRPARYAVATAWFVAALLTKTVTATLPAALLVVGWWRRGRLTWRDDFLPLLPWLGVGLAAGLGTAWLEVHHIGATGESFALGWIERGLLAGRIVWFYLGKLLWPAGLAFFYPRWTIDAGVAWQWLFPLALLAAVAAAGWWSRRDRGPLAAVLLYGGTLVPVLGFVNVYPFLFSYVADHFQYLASLGIIAFGCAAATRGCCLLHWPPATAWSAALTVLLALGGLTWRQSGFYRDGFTLYESTLARNPASWVAHLNLGAALDDAGRTAEALPHLQRALALQPDHPETLNSLGHALNRLERAAEARPFLERALQLRPRFAAAHNTLGATRMALGQADAGMASFRRALELDPGLTTARVNLAWALAHAGRGAEALAEFAAASRQWPEDPDLEAKWGLALSLQRRPEEALKHLTRAVALQPQDPAMRFALGSVMAELGQRTEALEQFAEVLRLAPHHAGARQAVQELRAAR